jgi:hypothetical protein
MDGGTAARTHLFSCKHLKYDGRPAPFRRGDRFFYATFGI